jgi:signal peptidase I
MIMYTVARPFHAFCLFYNAMDSHNVCRIGCLVNGRHDFSIYVYYVVVLILDPRAYVRTFWLNGRIGCLVNGRHDFSIYVYYVVVLILDPRAYVRTFWLNGKNRVFCDLGYRLPYL